MKAPAAFSHAEYQELAAFRYQLRRFLNFSEGAALEAGVEPRHHQALLAIKALSPSSACTVGSLAGELFLQHQSTVGLVDRMVQRGLIARIAGEQDRRQVLLSLTKHGEEVLHRLSLTHHAELEQRAPELTKALQAIIRRARSRREK